MCRSFQGPGGLLCVSGLFAHSWPPTLAAGEVQLAEKTSPVEGMLTFGTAIQCSVVHLPPPLFSSFFSDSEAGMTLFHQAGCVLTGEGAEQRDPGAAKPWQFWVLHLQQLLKDRAGPGGIPGGCQA